MKIPREELARMSIKAEPLRVARETTVANVSTTTAYPVERADNAQRPPQTRPPSPPRPRPPVVPPDKRTAPMRQVLEQQLRNRPVPTHPARPVMPVGTVGGGRSPGSDPQEGVGRGSVPPGGVKMR